MIDRSILFLTSFPASVQVTALDIKVDLVEPRRLSVRHAGCLGDLSDAKTVLYELFHLRKDPDRRGEPDDEQEV